MRHEFEEIVAHERVAAGQHEDTRSFACERVDHDARFIRRQLVFVAKRNRFGAAMPACKSACARHLPNHDARTFVIQSHASSVSSSRERYGNILRRRKTVGVLVRPPGRTATAVMATFVAIGTSIGAAYFGDAAVGALPSSV